MRKISILFLMSLGFYACDKDDPKADEGVILVYENQDLGIKFDKYTSTLTQSDTIKNHFTVTNYGPKTLKKGDTLKLATSFGGLTFALDLSGPGPTHVILEKELKVNESVSFNPGYLLKDFVLQYFQVPSVDGCILIYGVNQVKTDGSFGTDPNKANNTSCLSISTEGIKLN